MPHLYTAQGQYIANNKDTTNNEDVKETFGVLLDAGRICPPHYHEFYETPEMRKTKELICCPEFTGYNHQTKRCQSDPLTMPHTWGN